MKKEDFRKVYRVQILGVRWSDSEKSFDNVWMDILDSSIISEDWIDDFSKAVRWFNVACREELNREWFEYDDILIQLQYGEINIPNFESNFDIDFDLNDEVTQDCIPYELEYKWENVSEVYRDVLLGL